MHDRIRLGLSAIGIAAVTLAASGAPIPFLQSSHAGPGAPPVLASVPAAPAAALTIKPGVHRIPVSVKAPDAAHLDIRAPRIRRAASAEHSDA